MISDRWLSLSLKGKCMKDDINRLFFRLKLENNHHDIIHEQAFTLSKWFLAYKMILRAVLVKVQLSVTQANQSNFVFICGLLVFLFL